ncbi:MAG: Ni/Fe hydrogenase subunit alpha [Bdellovibrionaceae bacterium]|nr:Ni/Fe hydrogenase subunit alpha [Pseudobdellovibrionaceae bacterium]
MTKKITIEPVTRIEGHGKVTIHLDDNNQVTESRFHIVEFRGFEKFIQGRPYWEAPVVVQRLCGICPVSHHLAAAKAIDQVVGVDANGLTAVGEKMRRLMHYGQIFQSHALHFFYLAAPDLLFGIDADPKKRNIISVIQEHKELAKKGIQLRKFGQEIIRATAGKKIHGISAVPGGIHKNLSKAEIEYFLNDINVPSVSTCIQWMEEILDFMKDYHVKNKSWIHGFSDFPSNHLSLVGEDNCMDLYHGKLRAVDTHGKVILDNIDYNDYLNYFSEDVKAWTYLKFPYLKQLGPQKGWNRVGPLSRLNVCEALPTPRAQKRLEEYRRFTGQRINNMGLYYHWARLIEMLHCAEYMQDLLEDDDLQNKDLIIKGTRRPEGVGVIEAPRGTLLHHYEVSDMDEITRCNLIVSTTHNNEAMNRAVNIVAKRTLNNNSQVTEAMLNEIEVAIRAYDPCLSCATHAVGDMPLKVSLLDHKGKVLQEITKT